MSNLKFYSQKNEKKLKLVINNNGVKAESSLIIIVHYYLNNNNIPYNCWKQKNKEQQQKNYGKEIEIPLNRILIQMKSVKGRKRKKITFSLMVLCINFIIIFICLLLLLLLKRFDKMNDADNGELLKRTCETKKATE